MIYTSNVWDSHKAMKAYGIKPEWCWLITRTTSKLDLDSPKYAHLQYHDELAPSIKLVSEYWSADKAGRWTPQAFHTWYEQRFLTEMQQSKEAQRSLRRLHQANLKGENILLVCFCKEESMCHRTLVKRILENKQARINDGCYAGIVTPLPKKEEPKTMAVIAPQPWSTPEYGGCGYFLSMDGMKKYLIKYFNACIQHGIQEFVVPAWQGYCMEAVFALKELKKKHGITINVIAPYRVGFPKDGKKIIYGLDWKEGRWGSNVIDDLMSDQSINYIYLEDEWYANSYFKTNKYSINHSDVVFVVYDGVSTTKFEAELGSTMKTLLSKDRDIEQSIRYAIARHKRLVFGMVETDRKEAKIQEIIKYPCKRYEDILK